MRSFLLVFISASSSLSSLTCFPNLLFSPMFDLYSLLFSCISPVLFGLSFISFSFISIVFPSLLSLFTPLPYTHTERGKPALLLLLSSHPLLRTQYFRFFHSHSPSSMPPFTPSRPPFHLRHRPALLFAYIHDSFHSSTSLIAAHSTGYQSQQTLLPPSHQFHLCHASPPPYYISIKKSSTFLLLAPLFHSLPLL